MMVKTAKILINQSINPPTVIIKVHSPHSEHAKESCCGPCQRVKPPVGTGTSFSPVGRAIGNVPKEDHCQQQNSLVYSEEGTVLADVTAFHPLCWVGTAPTTPLALLVEGGEGPSCSSPPNTHTLISPLLCPRSRDLLFP